MARLIQITAGPVSLKAVLAENDAAERIFSILPWEGPFQTWGDEIYFEIPVSLPPDASATTRVRIGDIAYWPAGRALAIFFGPTPISAGKDPFPIDPVLPVGKIMGNAVRLKGAASAGKIRLEPFPYLKSQI